VLRPLHVSPACSIIINYQQQQDNSKTTAAAAAAALMWCLLIFICYDLSHASFGSVPEYHRLPRD